MRRTFGISVLCLLPLVFNSVSCWADGVSTSFADVTVSNVSVGKSWSFKKTRKTGLVLRNTGDLPMRMHVTVLVPQPTDLRGGAAALPDPQWIVVQPDDFDVAPHAQMDCDLVITIPDKTEYRGKLFQAMIFSKGAPVKQKNITFSTGLLSRLRFQAEN